jgi:diguanylate cyclase (GGDEF)-like protein
MGHSAGDMLRRTLGQAVRLATRQDDMLARVGGDELVLLAADCGDDAELRELPSGSFNVFALSAKTRAVVAFRLALAFGIATFPDRVKAIEGLLDAADAAMYVAKRSGRSTYRFGALPGPRLSNVLNNLTK